MRRLLERLLFGKEGLRRATEAERRFEAAMTDREKLCDDFDAARHRLRAAVDEAERRTRAVTSDPPPVVRYVVPNGRESKP